MSADTIRVDYDELNRIVAIFEDHMEQTRILLQRLETRAGELDWEGDNAVVFFGQFSDEVQPAIVRLMRAYDRASGTTREIIRVMTEAEDEAGAIFNGGAVGIGPGGGFNLGGILLPGGKFVSKEIFKYLSAPLRGQLTVPLTNAYLGLFARSGDEMTDLKRMFMQQDYFSKGMNKFGGGIIGGVFDYMGGAMSGEHEWGDMGALGNEMLSGGIQGGLAFIPGGQAVLLGDAVIQLGGTGLGFGAQIFEGVTGVDTSGFQDGVKSFTNMMSLDNFVDDLVQGNPGDIFERGGDFLESMGINL